MEKVLSLFKKYALFIVPIIAFLLNLLLSEVQGSVGLGNILLSFAFLIILAMEVFFVQKSIIKVLAKEIIYPRLKIAINQPVQDASTYEYLFQDSIITDRKLSDYEKKCDVSEIWLVSYDLTTEMDGGLYADVVPENLKRGIKYKYFVSNNKISVMRLEALKRKYTNNDNIKFYLLEDDFFFLVSQMDFTIYDPYKTSKSGRRGYIGLDLPDASDLYAARIGDDLVDAVAAKLIEYIPPEDK